jgi:hypothetical protein
VTRGKVSDFTVLFHALANGIILQRLMSESLKRYKREQELMMGALHAVGMRTARNHLGVPQQQPSSWLGGQRKIVSRSREYPSSH